MSETLCKHKSLWPYYGDGTGMANFSTQRCDILRLQICRAALTDTPEGVCLPWAMHRSVSIVQMVSECSGTEL